MCSFTDEYDFPDTVQALLWACCSPNDLGAPGVSPLGEAMRSGDDRAVARLLTFGAKPSRREDGEKDPIFLAIEAVSADYVQLLLAHWADPRSREAVPTAQGCHREFRTGRRKQPWKLLLLILESQGCY